MPPLPTLRIPALADLARQLRSSRPEVIRRQLERAEALAAEIDPAVNYPEDWVVFRVTGYRPEIAEPAMFVGEALLSDLAPLAERLSAAARLDASDLEPGRYLDAGELCARWRVSRKTLDRYRRRGLPARRVLGGNGKTRLAFALAAVEQYERRWGSPGAREKTVTRIAPGVEARIVERAGRYQRAGLSLNAAAARLARRHGRAHETIRQLLRRHEARSPVFAEAGPLTDRQRRFAERAARLAFEPGEIGARLGRSRASVHRVINDARVERLRGLGLPVVAGKGKRGAAADPLEPEPVRTGLGAPGEPDAASLLFAARRGEVPVGFVERSRASAYRFLVARAGRGIAMLPAHGAGATALDAIETDLRWAARLKAELVRSLLPLLIRTIESSLGRPAEELRAAALRPLLLASLAALAEAVDQHDPAEGGRLAAPAGMALSRAVPPFVKEHAAHAGRASSRLAVSVPMPDFTRGVAPWQAWLEPDRRVAMALARLDEPSRRVVSERFGFGGPPVTIAELARRLGTTPMRAARMERAAVRAALDIARGGL